LTTPSGSSNSDNVILPVIDIVDGKLHRHRYWRRRRRSAFRERRDKRIAFQGRLCGNNELHAASGARRLLTGQPIVNFVTCST
jgi:hypothetical protein